MYLLRLNLAFAWGLVAATRKGLPVVRSLGCHETHGEGGESGTPLNAASSRKRVQQEGERQKQKRSGEQERRASGGRTLC